MGHRTTRREVIKRAMVAFPGLALCSPVSALLSKEALRESAKLRLAVYDLPGVPFLGFLVAREYKYYEEAGLPPLKIQWRAEKETVFDLLRAGKADFAVSWMAEAIDARARGNDLVAIARIARDSAEAFAVRRDLFPTLDRIEHFEGCRIGLSFRRSMTAQAFLSSRGIHFDPVVFRPETGLIFTTGGVESIAVPAYYTNVVSRFSRFRDVTEVHPLSQYGFSCPEETILCRGGLLKSEPDFCFTFLKATYKGWKKAASDIPTSASILCRCCEEQGMRADMFLVREELKEWLGFLKLEKDGNGSCSEKDYDALAAVLAKSGLVPKEKIPPFKDFFRDLLNEGRP